MKKKKKSKKARKSNLTNSKLFDLLLNIFREKKSKLNYKQISKQLEIKDMVVKIQIIDVMKEMAESGIIEEVQRGAYRIIEKSNKIICVIKNTNNQGAFASIDKDNEVFIDKKSSQFVLAGDEVEVNLFPKRKKRQEGEVVNVIKRKKLDFVGEIDSTSTNYFLIPDDRRVSFDIFLPPKSIKKDYL